METHAQNGHVTALAVLQYIWGGAIVLLGLIVAVAGATFSAFIGRQFSEFGGDTWGSLGAVMFVVFGLVFVAVGSTGIISATGLIRYREWGRIFTLIMATVAGLLALASLADLDIVGAIVPGGFSAYAWIMLTRAEIIALFRAETSPRPALPA